jgi:hypothetical protein
MLEFDIHARQLFASVVVKVYESRVENGRRLNLDVMDQNMEGC